MLVWILKRYYTRNCFRTWLVKWKVVEKIKVLKVTTLKKIWILKMKSLRNEFRFFLYHRSHVLLLKFSIFYILNYSINFERCYAHSVKCIFEHIFWIVKKNLNLENRVINPGPLPTNQPLNQTFPTNANFYRSQES